MEVIGYILLRKSDGLGIVIFMVLIRFLNDLKVVEFF